MPSSPTQQEESRVTKFVLRENTKERKEPLWFWRMTGIGPATTADPSERAVFESREEALACPCWRHTYTFWEIEEVTVDA